MDRQTYDYQTGGKQAGEAKAKETSAASTTAASREKQSTTAGAGLGSLANRMRKKAPMPMLTDFNGDRSKFDAALAKWRGDSAADPETAAQKKALSR